MADTERNEDAMSLNQMAEYLANKLNIGVSTVRLRWREWKIPAVEIKPHLIRFRRESVDRWIEERETAAP